jgi:mRNA interferase RelE/StbE
MPSPTKVLLDREVVDFASRLHPDTRRAIKAALRALAEGKGDIAPLAEDLAGLYRLRVGRFRIIYRHDSSTLIRCFFMEERRIVYDTLRLRPDLWD